MAETKASSYSLHYYKNNNMRIFIVVFISLVLSGCFLGGSDSDSSALSREFTGPLVISSNFEGEVYTSEILHLDFNQPIDANGIRYNTESGACIGDIQLSTDNFATCIGLEFVLSGSNYLELSAVEFNAGEQYQFFVSAEIQSTYNNKPEADYYREFVTLESSALLITEVGIPLGPEFMNWFEIYNTTNRNISLGDYALKSVAAFGRCETTCDLTFDESYTFSLPNQDIEPGQYVIIRAQNWSSVYTNSSGLIHVGDSNTHLYWEDKGYLELINTSLQKTEDFVVFGSWSSLPQPMSASAWKSEGQSAPGLPYSFLTQDYGQSLKRHVRAVDSNEASDWTLSSFYTPGAPNDVTCDVDLDLDGLPDCSEQEGATYSGIDVYALGARENQPDIFIEVDYMDSLDEGVKPRIEALQKVKDVFAAQNIAVHFDVGDLYDQAPGLNPEKFDLGGGNQTNLHPFIGFYPESGSGIDSFYDIKRMNMDNLRLPVFHYLLMAYESFTKEEEGYVGALGIAELNANDIIVSLGNENFNSSSPGKTNQLINVQASTIMHELGHNLGLRHGGFEEKNHKPNYLSVMNYLYSFAGLPTIGSADEGDRYYLEFCASDFGNVNNDFWVDPSEFNLDYSHGLAMTLNENLIDEEDGLGMPASNFVDFNCDKVSNIPYALDINKDDVKTFLHDHDDWSNLNLRFQRDFWGVANLFDSNNPDLARSLKPIASDKTQVIVD